MNSVIKFQARVYTKKMCKLKGNMDTNYLQKPYLLERPCPIRIAKSNSQVSRGGEKPHGLSTSQAKCNILGKSCGLSQWQLQ